MIDSDMKKITNLLYMLAVLLLASCSDFLDKSPKNTVDPETTVTDDVAIALTNACYRTLQSSNMYNQRIWTLDIVAGNSLVGAGGGTDGLETDTASNFIIAERQWHGIVHVAFSLGGDRTMQHCVE